MFASIQEIGPEASKQGMVGASYFHLLGVGAEKSSLYRLGLLGFDAYPIIIKRGRKVW